MTARYFGRAIHERFERIQAQLSDLSAVTQEALAGVRVVRAYRQEARELERFRAANLEYVDRNRALIRLQGLFYPSMGLFMGGAELLVLWLGSRDVIAGRMSVGELVAFSGYLAMLAWPMIAFGWVTNLVQRGRASWGRMQEVLATVPAIDDRHVEFPDDRPGGCPRRRHVRRPELRLRRRAGARWHLARRFAPGRPSASSGAPDRASRRCCRCSRGSTTRHPARVFIDGRDVRELPLATVRGASGVVPQEPFLFSDTIAGNVAFGASRPG